MTMVSLCKLVKWTKKLFTAKPPTLPSLKKLIIIINIIHLIEQRNLPSLDNFVINALFSLFLSNRNCIIGPQLDVKICALGTVINRLSYPADYCHLEGAGRQSQPMPIRWMAWESVLLVSVKHMLFLGKDNVLSLRQFHPLKFYILKFIDPHLYWYVQ